MQRDALRALAPGRLEVAVLLLSAAVLAHEICLLRVLSQAHWHHAASLVVAVALLAFGVAGTILALAPALRREETVAVCAGLYAVGIPLALRAVEPIGLITWGMRSNRRSGCRIAVRMNPVSASR